jgi:hypothetical protein
VTEPSGYDTPTEDDVSEAFEDGFREGMQAARCGDGCQHHRTCPQSDEYRLPLRDKLKSLFGGQQ